MVSPTPRDTRTRAHVTAPAIIPPIIPASFLIESVRPNDPAQQRRGLLNLHVVESRRAPAVCCSAWIGAASRCSVADSAPPVGGRVGDTPPHGHPSDRGLRPAAKQCFGVPWGIRRPLLFRHAGQRG